MRTLNPAVKFVTLLAVTLILAGKHDPILNFAVFLLSMAAILSAQVKPRTLGLLLLPILLAAAGMFFTGYRFHAGGSMPVRAEILNIGSSALWNGLTQASRVLAYAGAGYLFALTTDRVRMICSFQRQFHLPQVFAYGLLAAWGIFPQMTREYRRTRAAFRARGIRVFPISPALLKPLLVKSVRWSEALAIAMESKGFSGQAKRTDFAPIRVQPRDWLFLLLTVGCTAAAAVLL